MGLALQFLSEVQLFLQHFVLYILQLGALTRYPERTVLCGKMAEDRAVAVQPEESDPQPKVLPTQWISAMLADDEAVKAATTIMEVW